MFCHFLEASPELVRKYAGYIVPRITRRLLLARSHICYRKTDGRYWCACRLAVCRELRYAMSAERPPAPKTVLRGRNRKTAGNGTCNVRVAWLETADCIGRCTSLTQPPIEIRCRPSALLWRRPKPFALV